MQTLTRKSDFRQAINEKYRLANRLVEIQTELSKATPWPQRQQLKAELCRTVKQVREIKRWLREREGDRPCRRAIDILCDLYTVVGFAVKYAQEHGYELTEKETELFDEAGVIVDAHLEKRKPVTRQELA